MKTKALLCECMLQKVQHRTVLSTLLLYGDLVLGIKQRNCRMKRSNIGASFDTLFTAVPLPLAYASTDSIIRHAVVWSSGMIPASGAGGREFNSRLSPLFF